MKEFTSKKYFKGKTAELYQTADGPAWNERLVPNSPVRLMKTQTFALYGIRLTKCHILGMTTFPNREKDKLAFLGKVKRHKQEIK